MSQFTVQVATMSSV